MAIVYVVGLLIIVSVPAHAYIDPGSGSYMLQIALAGLLAGFFTLKLHWQRLREKTVALLHIHADARRHARR